MKPLLFCLLLFPVSMPLYAAGIAKYAGEFLSTGVGARALGMGGAHAAMPGDVIAGYWNPAGLASIDYPEIAGMHSRRFGGVVNYDVVALATPFRSTASLGLTVIRLAVDDIPITALPRPGLAIGEFYQDDEGQQKANRPYVERTVNDAEYAFLLSYARSASARFAYGANVKFIRKGMGDHTAWGIGFDIGALWNPWHELLAGVNLQDGTTTLLAWDTGRQELISPTLKAGLSYPFSIGLLASELRLAGDVDLRFEGRDLAAQAAVGPASLDLHLGAEWLVRRAVALRLGSDSGHLTAGAGLRLPRLDVDYAFLSHDELKVTHRVSLRLRFEEEQFARQ